MDVPIYVTVIFLAIVVAMFYLVLAGLHHGLSRMGHPARKRLMLFTILGLAGWFALLAFLSHIGFLKQFDKMPPRMFLALLIPLIFIIIFVNRKFSDRLLEHIPGYWIVYAQVFRLPLEMVLWLLFVEHILPIQMTFEGYNFDVLTALTAPAIGYFYSQKQSIPKSVAIGWNIGGIILVAVIVTIAILSFPTPFRQFMNEPSNTVVAYIPYVWLPGFLVPVAILLHLLSLKQLMKRS